MGRLGMGRLGMGLPRQLWLVEVGIFLNMVGYGAVLPFEIIYLHSGRGFSVGVAGLVVGAITGVAVVTAPLTGPLIDRFGARIITAAGGVALAAGYAGLALAHTPVQALVAAAVAGAGNGALNPSQTALLTALAPANLRHRATAVSRVAANAGMGIGSALGGVVAAYGLTGFVALFLLNAVTYLVYVAVLVVVVREGARPEALAGGYRRVLRDGAFVQLAITNVAIIAVGWGAFTWLVPPFARDSLGISAPLIGLLLLANAVTVVVAQVPVARLAEGRRRVLLMVQAAIIFAGACLLVIAARLIASLAYPALLVASIAVAIGECLHTTALTPLAADLAPPALRGRYLAMIGFSFWIGLAIAPSLGGRLLGEWQAGAFVLFAAVAAAAAISALLLERRLPESARLTPRPRAAEISVHGKSGRPYHGHCDGAPVTATPGTATGARASSGRNAPARRRRP
jgi:MFS family permease